MDAQGGAVMVQNSLEVGYHGEPAYNPTKGLI